MNPEEKLWYDALIEKGHTPIMVRNNPGRLNMEVYNYDIHHGPGCKTCGWSCCSLCRSPASVPVCTKPFTE